MPALLLTSALVQSSICPSDKRKVDFFDTQTKGLLLEVRSSGGKTYYLRYQDHRGRTRQLRLADADDVSLSQVRTLAGKMRNKIALGVDPCEEKATLKTVPTFSQFAEKYLEFVRCYKRSWKTDESLLKNHLLPRFSKRYMDEIGREDIRKMHQSRLSEGAMPGTANRLLIMMRYMFNLALRWEIPNVTANPTAGVPLFEENNIKERYLSSDEAQTLYDTILVSKNKTLQYIVPMLILTGARKREVLDSKWADLDLDNKRWRIPTTKSGKARHVPLSDGALRLLNNTPRIPDCPWVFPNPDTKRPYVSVFYSWDTARKKAGLADVRMHDLRHSFASLLVNSGRTLYEVQHLLGHTQVKTTQRYAHLSQDTLLAASNAASSALGDAMSRTHFGRALESEALLAQLPLDTTQVKALTQGAAQ